MAINTNLLVAAPMLQDYLVDNATGFPLAAGVISLYQDNSRTTFKNWYYQSGSPGAYTYITLPNPLTLSGVGTIADPNGNDTIPFFYPFSETDNSTAQPYYITVDNSNGQRQFVRQNFPFVAVQSSPGSDVETLRNYILNNVFWRNVTSVNLSSSLQAIISPSQHDGFVLLNDTRWVKNTTDATDTITFSNFTSNFPDNILPNDITPEYYINLNCSGAGTETEKYIQFPISLHVDSLSAATGTIVIQGMNVSGNVNNQITLSIYQYLGAGVTSPTPIISATLTLGNSWQKYSIPLVLPSSQGLTLGQGGDDAYFLQVGFPTAKTCNINIAKPGFYLGDIVPTNDFDNYDQVNSIISSPRTGDIRISLNIFTPFGWLLLNDGTIGLPASNATCRANKDTWPLFYTLWTSVSNTYAPLLDSTGTPVARGVSAIADFTSNHAITVTKMLGRVLASAGLPSSGSNVGTTWAPGQTTGNEVKTLSIANLPDHDHPGSVDYFQSVTVQSGIGTTIQQISNPPGSGTGNITVASQGSGTGVNIQDPVIYLNVFIKL